MHLKLGGSFGLAQTDFLDAQLNVTGIIVTMIVPFFTVNFIRNRLQVSFPNDPGMRAVEFQHLQTLAQVIIAFYVTFVGYLKSPEWAGVTWIKVAPAVHLLLLVVAMLVIPMMVVIQTLTLWGSIHSSAFSGPLLLYPFISVCVILQFPIYFLGRIKEAWRLVSAKREKIERWYSLKLAREKGGK